MHNFGTNIFLLLHLSDLRWPMFQSECTKRLCLQWATKVRAALVYTFHSPTGNADDGGSVMMCNDHALQTDCLTV